MNRSVSRHLVSGLAVLVVLATGAAADAATGGDFLRAERAVLGDQASQGWRGAVAAERGLDRRHFQAPDEFGGGAVDERDDEPGGANNLGRKVRAGVLSAILPGAGQYYNGKKERAYIMGGVEVAIWTAYFVFDKQGDNRMESSREWAGIYAGTSGDHPESYWQNVGFYMEYRDYNEFLLREARALQEPDPVLISPENGWIWVNEERRRGYAKLRADGNSAYDRRDFMILFAVLNRTVSVVDAVLGAGAPDGKLEAEVMGMNMQLDLDPGFVGAGRLDPTARCVVSRSF